MDEWLKMLDVSSGGHINVISLDWEKAFEKIPHSRLILKLKNAGISGSLLKWLQCFFFVK
jgi:ribonuclease P/MRP protein subunit RPP40